MTYILVMILAQGPAMQEFNSKESCELAVEAIRQVHAYGVIECVMK